MAMDEMGRDRRSSDRRRWAKPSERPLADPPQARPGAGAPREHWASLQIGPVATGH